MFNHLSLNNWEEVRLQEDEELNLSDRADYIKDKAQKNANLLLDSFDFYDEHPEEINWAVMNVLTHPFAENAMVKQNVFTKGLDDSCIANGQKLWKGNYTCLTRIAAQHHPELRSCMGFHKTQFDLGLYKAGITWIESLYDGFPDVFLDVDTWLSQLPKKTRERYCSRTGWIYTEPEKYDQQKENQ